MGDLAEGVEELDAGFVVEDGLEGAEEKAGGCRG